MTYKCCFGQYFWRCTKKDIDLKKWLHAVWYCKKCVSAQYDTARNVTLHSMILQGMWLCAVWYCKECDSAQYDTVWSLTLCSIIPSGDLKNSNISVKTTLKGNYFNPLVSGPGRFEWWKKRGVKNLVGLSIKGTVSRD